jgi:hypothetical protein
MKPVRICGKPTVTAPLWVVMLVMVRAGIPIVL